MSPHRRNRRRRVLGTSKCSPECLLDNRARFGQRRDRMFQGRTIWTRPSLDGTLWPSRQSRSQRYTNFSVGCLPQYLSDAYKKDFEWIDQIKDVRDQEILAGLDKWLVGRIAVKNLEKIWMSIPALLDWVDMMGFRYSSKKDGPMYSDLDVASFLNAVGKKEVTLEILKSRTVVAISAKTDDVADHWPAYKCP